MTPKELDKLCYYVTLCGDIISEHIEIDCAPDNDYLGYDKGIVIEDDDAHLISDIAKGLIRYDRLKKIDKVTEINIDKTWDSLMRKSASDPESRKTWNALVNAAHDANHGLLVINISNIKIFGHCWKLKQLVKQEAPLELWPGHISGGPDTRFNFDGYVLMILKGITFSDASKYAASKNNLGEYRAMMTFFTKFSL